MVIRKCVRVRNPSRSPIRIAAVCHGNDAYAVLFVVDDVDRPVFAPAGAPDAVQWRVELLAEPPGILGDRPGQVVRTSPSPPIIHSGRSDTGDGTESASTAANRSKMANRFVVVTWAVRAAAWLALRDRRENRS